MKRCHNRHSQFAQQGQDMATRRTAINAEFMLQTNNVYVTDIEKIRSPEVRRQVLLFNLEADDIWVFVAAWNIIY